MHDSLTVTGDIMEHSPESYIRKHMQIDKRQANLKKHITIKQHRHNI